MDALDRRLIARLCGDLGDSLDPYGDIAAELGTTRDEVLARARRYRDTGKMRRLGAVLYHRRAGFTANGMSVWNIPDEQVEQIGARIAAHPEVTHCYVRPRQPEWPYNLFAMVHARDEATCRATVARIAADIGITDYDILFSTREFKKSSMVYFG